MERKIPVGIRDSGYRRRVRIIDFRKKDWLIIFLTLFGFYFFIFLFSYFPNTYVFLSSFLSQFWINLSGVALIGIVGGLLYLLRQSKRTGYGIIEVSFALAYGWYSINKVAQDGYFETVGIIAAIYLVVRGVDNIMEGIKQREEAKQLSAEKENLPAQES